MTHTNASYGIEAASYFLPPRMAVADWVREHQEGAEALLQLHSNGMRHFHHAGDKAADSLAIAATHRLLERHPVDPLSIDLVVFVHSLRTSTPPAPASLPLRLAGEFGLARARCFALSGQNCASLLVALRLLQSLFRTDPSLDRVLLVSADRACGERHRNVGAFSFESDGACALLLSRHHPYNRAVAFAGHLDGRHRGGADRSVDQARQYRALYGLFAHRLIHQTAKACRLTPADFDHLLPINLDRHVFDRLATSLRMPGDWVFTANISEHGHVMCCDVVINLLDLWERNALKSPARLLFFMSGNNGAFSTMALDNCHSFHKGLDASR